MDSLLSQLMARLHQGPASANAMAKEIGVSPQTVSRALRPLGSGIVRIGRGRASRYALARPVGRAGSHWPLHRMTPAGEAERLGELHAFHGGWFLETDQPLPLFFHEEFANGDFPDLPWFLDDLRPQGFLGRAFVRRYAADLQAPDNLDLWQADDVVTALLRRGDDLPGDLILGEHALQAALHDRLFPAEAAITGITRGTIYLERAELVEAGEAPGSSAGGEQPKFTAQIEAPGGTREWVIVKFARHDPDNVALRRWTNLLACEHIAGQVLAEHGVAVARTEFFDHRNWRFLQSSRFDRTPEGGRRGVSSLRALDAAFIGHGAGSWLPVADALHSAGLLAEGDAETMRRLYRFGQLIGNTDMHFGNLSFHTEPDRLQVTLAPVYDMLPMHYRPNASGAVSDRPYELPIPALQDREDWRWAARAAREFWRRVKLDDAIGPKFRVIAEGNEDRILTLKQRLGIL